MENESINTNQNTEQQPTTPTPEASGDQGAEKLFTQTLTASWRAACPGAGQSGAVPR